MDQPDDAVLRGVATVVETVTGLPADHLRPEHRFVDDLRIDSLAMVEVLEGCRARLGIAVSDHAAGQLVHVGDLLDYLRVHSR